MIDRKKDREILAYLKKQGFVVSGVNDDIRWLNSGSSQLTIIYKPQPDRVK